MGRLLLLSTCAVFSLHLPVVGSASLESSLAVYNVPQTTSSYFYQNDIPAMTEATICLWFKGVEDDDNRSGDYLFSIAEPQGDEDNLVIGWQGAEEVVFYAGGTINNIYASEQGSVAEALWLGWNKHCFTWKSSGTVAWYSDKDTSGLLELIGSTAAASNVVLGSGVLILCQEQDSYGGGFDLSQAAYGGIAWFNIWNYEMTETELNALGCMDTGNVVSMDSLQMQGTIENSTHAFPCNDGTQPWLQQEGSGMSQIKMFCYIKGASLGGHDILTETVQTIARCASLCLRNESCLSANYNKVTKDCTLNDDVHSYNIEQFNKYLSVDYLHITSRKCDEDYAK